MSDTPKSKITPLQWVLIVLSVTAMWSISNAYESYLKYDLEQYRIEHQISAIKKQNELLDQLYLSINRQKRAGSKEKVPGSI